MLSDNGLTDNNVSITKRFNDDEKSGFASRKNL